MNEAFVRSGNAAQRRALLKLERASGKKRCGVSMRQYGEEDRAVGGELPLYDMLIPYTNTTTTCTLAYFTATIASAESLADPPRSCLCPLFYVYVQLYAGLGDTWKAAIEQENRNRRGFSLRYRIH